MPTRQANDDAQLINNSLAIEEGRRVEEETEGGNEKYQIE